MAYDIYSKKIRIARQKNIKQVKTLLENNDKGLRQKIKNSSKRYQISEEYIRKQILAEEPLALALFAKDPAKQKIHERIAGGYIQKIEGVTNFRILKNTELYISRGQIISKEQSKLATAKTIDFYFQYGKYEVYVSNKHTTEEGEAQDNQYKDLQEFITECRDNTDSNVIFIAIADGDYYKGNNGKTGVSKMENLKSKCTQSVRACAIYELKEVLDSI